MEREEGQSTFGCRKEKEEKQFFKLFYCTAEYNERPRNLSFTTKTRESCLRDGGDKCY